ncbi:MAG: hypothetical protein R2761_12470 [Acidimicrobiales bacterium]
MQPVSVPLLLLGYALALPIGMKLGKVMAQQHRVALLGHQVGILLAVAGWALRGRTAMIVLHVLWLFAARVWFDLAGRRQRSAVSSG